MKGDRIESSKGAEIGGARTDAGRRAHLVLEEAIVLMIILGIR